MATTKQARPDLVPVIELVRTSTDRQDVARQRTSLDKRREMKPGQVIERLEIAFSGTKSLAELGAAGKRLVELAKAKAFRELRVSSYDHLIGARSMDPRIQAEILGLCMDAGAVLIEADTGMEIQPGTLMGNAMAAFRGGASAQERIQHLSRTNQDARRPRSRVARRTVARTAADTTATRCTDGGSTIRSRSRSYAS